MNMTLLPQTFISPSAKRCIDGAKLVDGQIMSQYCNKTIEDLRTEYPDVILVNDDEASATIESLHITEPQLIEEWQFVDALNCLPPCKWTRASQYESFHISERIYGNIAAFYVRVRSRYYRVDTYATTSHEQVVNLCKSAKCNLFSCCMATGISYSNRAVEADGDYKRIAHLYFHNLELSISDPHSYLLESVKADAAKIQARKGEQYQVSSCGQTVTLGYAL